VIRRAVGPAQRTARSRRPGGKEEEMWWWIGIGGIVYLILLFTLGIVTLRKGQGWMFLFGIFFPVLWLIGGFMQPTSESYT
jgi:hypothetical protein